MIYTSYFGNCRNLPAQSRQVCIARGRPGWFTGESLLPQFDMVAPFPSLIGGYKQGRIKPDEYVGIYLNQLRQLDVLAFANHYDGAILLCYEKVGDFCHRHILAHLLMTKFNVRVIEFGVDK